MTAFLANGSYTPLLAEGVSIFKGQSARSDLAALAAQRAGNQVEAKRQLERAETGLHVVSAEGREPCAAFQIALPRLASDLPPSPSSFPPNWRSCGQTLPELAYVAQSHIPAQVTPSRR